METSTWKDQLVMLESYMYIVTLYNNLYTDKRRYNSKCTNRVHKEESSYSILLAICNKQSLSNSDILNSVTI